MKLTKGHIQKLLSKQNQTRKLYKNTKNKKLSNHIISLKNKKKNGNLHLKTMKNI